VIEHHLKWAPLCETLPGPMFMGETASNRLGRYDFHHCDLIVDWCLAHGIKVKGHVLVWHVTSPSFLVDLTPEELREQLRRHIYTVMGHFRGRISIWDVVNEALAPDGTLAQNIFYQKLGPSYIDDSFRWAHDADPNAFLIYNDNKVEGCGLMPECRSKKADAFYNLLKGMKERGVPVHGAGMQAHFNAAGTGLSQPPTPRSVKAQIRRLGNLGLRVNLSEMDVRIGKGLLLPKSMQECAQRQIYHDIIASALTEPSFDGVWFWGVTDRHSWVYDFYNTKQDESNEDPLPLLFDRDYNKKDSAYGAVRDALNTLTVHGRVGGNVLLGTCFVGIFRFFVNPITSQGKVFKLKQSFPTIFQILITTLTVVRGVSHGLQLREI
jgi:endo-1,4-beta-xylanase